MTTLIDQYTYRLTWSGEDAEFVGLCSEFPGLSWLATTQQEALAGIRKLVRQCLNDMEKHNEPLPEPLSRKNFSGKLMLRIPPEKHRSLAMEAAEAGVSLNRLIASRLY